MCINEESETKEVTYGFWDLEGTNKIHNIISIIEKTSDAENAWNMYGETKSTPTLYQYFMHGLILS